MYILGIETSCDETAASILKVNQDFTRFSSLANVIASQIDIHKEYGGVVPEVAAREHLTKMLPVIDQALTKAKLKPKEIDYLTITKGPGLISSLLVGLETARALAYAWQKPIIEVNHIYGHLYANFIDPILVLTVSGGHTNIFLIEKDKEPKVIGKTLDDAAGEAFDKGAKMMGLGYPGGPAISKQADIYEKKLLEGKLGATTIKLPRPMLTSKTFDFSFSGLKTALLYQLQKDDNWQKRIPEYCYYYQEAIIDILIAKTIKAVKKYQVNTVMLSGGVSANRKLRIDLEKAVAKDLEKVDFFAPKLEFTTDNAAMIAVAGAFALKDKKINDYKNIKVDPIFHLG